MDTIEIYGKNGECNYIYTDNNLRMADDGEQLTIYCEHVISKREIGKIIIHRTNKNDITIRL